MHQVSANFVPRLLQRENEDENLLKNVITGGFTVMTLKPKNNPHTGRVKAMLLYLGHQGICIMNLLLKVRQFIKIFIW
jgi:hypothetical protein